MLESYLSIFINAVFIENIALSVFLGMCTFIAISKKIDAAIGLGIAVIVIIGITVPLNNGQIIESGKHEKLLENKNLYREMWDKQNNKSSYSIIYSIASFDIVL